MPEPVRAAPERAHVQHHAVDDGIGELVQDPVGRDWRHRGLVVVHKVVQHVGQAVEPLSMYRQYSLLINRTNQ